MADLHSILISRLRTRLEIIEEKHGYLTQLISDRFANEKLFQLETMHIISSLPGVTDYLPEKVYSDGREKCDFWFNHEGTDCWLEIKTRPTNYHKEGHSKGIKNSVDGVIEDIKRLKKISAQNAQKYVLFAFYPMYEDSYHVFNTVHLPRIAKALGKAIHSSDLHLKTDDGFFDVYLENVI